MVTLTFYGGAGEIGGNKFLLEDKGAKVYFDFGASFTFGEEYFFDRLQPRSANGLEVYFDLGMMPRVRKLYSKDKLKMSDMRYMKPDVDAIFITHSHSDHIGHLPFVDEDIPVYLGECTKSLIDVYDDLYNFGIGEHNNVHLFKSGQTQKIKHLEITPVHVEHSVPGAYGFIIKTSKGNIVYTGDFRIHGPRADLTKDFIRAASAARPFALLCEGTRMQADVEHNFTEEEVRAKVDEITSRSKGTVFGYFSMSNVDRFMSFYNTAVKNNRIMVVNVNFAHILAALKPHIKGLPDVYTDKHMKVYYRVRKTCTFCESDYDKCDRVFMKNMVTFREMAKHPKKYIMHMRFVDLMELVYLQPKNADFIYSSSEHFYEGEEHEEERAVWQNWMTRFGIKFHKAHCSGHADRKGIIEAVSTIKPKVLIPIHTQVPEAFKKFHGNVRLPEAGKTIEI